MKTTIILFLSFILGVAGAWFISRYAYLFGLLDVPNDRSSHSLPTPRGGGIGILLAFTASSLWLTLPITFWMPAVLLSLISFFDDKLNLSPGTRLVFQFAAALVVVGFSASVPPFQPVTSALSPFAQYLPFLLLPLLAVFMVGTANFFNFMDGINGIAGITGAIGFALLAAFAVLNANMPGLALSALCMSAACLGFLPFNVFNASVFMGDVGSILLGFVFAALVIFLSSTAADFLLLAGFLSTFYADTLTTLYIRRRDGEPLSRAHRRHLYQLFTNQLGVAHWRVAVCYGAVQALVGATLLALRPAGMVAMLAFMLAFFYCWWVVMMRVRRQVEIMA
jgi:UDP-N-acetylmuramyl pentapeptide phosphotransferase/UDP-N-acetylglucosamine-1-phosphate transferase